jgi:hypothetical protein
MGGAIGEEKDRIVAIAGYCAMRKVKLPAG